MRPMKCESLMEKDGTLRLSEVLFPKLASPKLDGNRCYIEDGQAKSSSGKPIRNVFIRETLSQPEFDGLDGELIVGASTAKDVRRKTSSGVGTFQGEPDFTFHVFDYWKWSKEPFRERLTAARGMAQKQQHIRFVPHSLITCIDDLLKYEESMLALGYEGVILRDANAPYKQGRSTLKQNWALKLKRFLDGEAVVVGIEEMYHNENEALTDDHGYTKRSSHQENKRAAGVLGALVVKDLKTGVEFRVGTGFDAVLRASLWVVGRGLIGQVITYKHFPIGAKDKPNLPSFVAFRDLEDMDAFANVQQALVSAENPF